MLEYWLEFFITKNTVNLESSICVLANDLCQCHLVFNHFPIWDIVTCSELDCFDTVLKNAREFTNIVSMNRSTLY